MKLSRTRLTTVIAIELVLLLVGLTLAPPKLPRVDGVFEINMDRREVNIRRAKLGLKQDPDNENLKWGLVGVRWEEKDD